MKRRRLFLSQPLLPTITETLEDLPAHPSSSQSTQGSQSQEDYMISIQALARPVEAPGYGPVRLQRSPRIRQFSKAQMKLSVSASVPRGSPQDFSLKMSRERDCRGKDPVDWLFGLNYPAVYPSIHYLYTTKSSLGSRGSLSQTTQGEGRGHPGQVNSLSQGHTYRQTTKHTTRILESPINLNMFLDYGRNRENPERTHTAQREHANSTQKDPGDSILRREPATFWLAAPQQYMK
uniref:Uncharacterized protein n=1 Tax=Stegastes partitus TaxID=144197 RepID=A0A3B5BLU1_9TELE